MFCETYHALPFPGGVLEQPFGLLLVMQRMRVFAKAFAVYDRMGAEDAPTEALQILQPTMPAVLEAMRRAKPNGSHR